MQKDYTAVNPRPLKIKLVNVRSNDDADLLNAEELVAAKDIMREYLLAAYPDNTTIIDVNVSEYNYNKAVATDEDVESVLRNIYSEVRVKEVGNCSDIFYVGLLKASRPGRIVGIGFIASDDEDRPYSRCYNMPSLIFFSFLERSQ